MGVSRIKMCNLLAYFNSFVNDLIWHFNEVLFHIIATGVNNHDR